ncbi:MAG TPA: AMP-binding protein [Candidatus Limnocylindrales bacterium]|nr:AMP-binding protein [Candidatus Limnocylindrales bacterium]
MDFLERIFDRLQQAETAPVLREVRHGEIVTTTGGELLALIGQARAFLRARGLKPADRCALLAPNSIRWAALDLAMMAEGIVVVPLYARQAPAELAAMIADSKPSRLFCSDAVLAAQLEHRLPPGTHLVLIDGIFAGDAAASTPPVHHSDSDTIAIIYTSGTSGEAKGVVLNAGNVNHILGCTGARLDQLMATRKESAAAPDRVFHYAPFCFAASWILLLSALSRNSVLTLSTDLTKLADELKLAAPDYFLNVPTLLDRVRSKIEETVRARGGFASAVFSRAQRAFVRRQEGRAGFLDSLCFSLANRIMFPTIRKSIGPNLKALICGSAPLAVETQLFFMMLGIPVLQVYGLTETTAICTMDDPGHVMPGCVGQAIPGLEMKLSDDGEILARGPNIFPGYWQRPAETAKALDGGWFHTGDQGEVDSTGNWRITGRIKNLIVLNSGHKLAPEPLEQSLAVALPDAQQVVLVGNQRSFLTALIAVNSANGFKDSSVQPALDAINAALPHYKQIRAFHIVPEPFTIESGLLTANGKLKRDAIASRFASEIDAMYQKKPS